MKNKIILFLFTDLFIPYSDVTVLMFNAFFFEIIKFYLKVRNVKYVNSLKIIFTLFLLFVDLKLSMTYKYNDYLYNLKTA